MLSVALIVIWIGLVVWSTLKFEDVEASFFIAGLGLIFLVFTLFPFNLEPRIERDGTWNIEIVQLKERDESSLKGGGSFLGWSINGENEPQYVIMENIDGRMIRRFLSQKTTYIVESDETPRVEYNHYKKTWPEWRSFPWLWDNDETYFRYDEATIVVPIGTVAVRFDGL